MRSTLVLLTIVACVAGEYCPGAQSGNQEAQDSNLGNVVMGSMEQKGDCNDKEIGIQWFPKSIAYVNAGSTSEMTVQVITCGHGYERKTAAWVDLNGNQVFEDWEKFGESDVGAIEKPVLVTWKFKVPSKTSSKVTSEKAVYLSPDGKPNTRMRIMVVENGFDPMDPCLQFPYGAVKDFPIVLQLAGLDIGAILLITVFVCAFVGFFVAMGVFYKVKQVPPQEFVKEKFLPPVTTFCGLVKDGVLFTAFKCKCTKKRRNWRLQRIVKARLTKLMSQGQTHTVKHTHTQCDNRNATSAMRQAQRSQYAQQRNLNIDCTAWEIRR